MLAPAREKESEEEAVNRRKALEIDSPPHAVLTKSTRIIDEVVDALRYSRVGVFDELKLTDPLNTRIVVLKELQKRLSTTHGSQVWVVLARCISTLKMVTEQLRDLDVSQDSPGANAARVVGLVQQGHALRQLSVRLRPTQEVVCGAAVIW